MIKINIEEHRLQELETQYKEALLGWLDKRKNKDAADKSPEWEYYIKNCESLITCKPKDMKEQWDLFKKGKIGQDYQKWDKLPFKKKKNSKFGKFIKKMTDLYNNFMKDKCLDINGVGYWFFGSLGLDVCPYCNRNYIFTVEVDKDKKNKKNKYRPEIDHFYSKSRYPIFALSFYNFVPACPTCNHIKGDRELIVSPWEGYNGYTGGKKGPVFRVKNTVEDFFLEAPKIEIIDGEPEDISILGIDRLYNKHNDVVKDILNRIQAYNTDAYSAVIESFQGIVNTEGELDRMVWGNYTDPDEFSKRPLSKLTSDILKQYKIK